MSQTLKLREVLASIRTAKATGKLNDAQYDHYGAIISPSNGGDYSMLRRILQTIKPEVPAPTGYFNLLRVIQDLLGPDNRATLIAAVSAPHTVNSRSPGARRGRWFRRLLCRELGLPRFKGISR